MPMAITKSGGMWPRTRLGAVFFAVLVLIFALCAELSHAAQDAQNSRQVVRAQINPGGPENWPESGGLSTATSGGAAPSATAAPAGQPAPVVEPHPVPQAVEPAMPPFAEPEPSARPVEPAPEAQAAPHAQPRPKAAAAPATPQAPQVSEKGAAASGSISGQSVGLPLGQTAAEPAQAAPREVIYVDEQGNPVPKPPEPDKMYQEAITFMDQGKFDDAIPVLQNIRQIPNIPPALEEKVLYAISDCLWARYADNPLAGFEPIVSSTHEALNSNLRSARVPDALLRLGLAHINVGNLKEAQGYVTALMRRFPDYPGVAQGLTALGQAQLKNGQNAEAERSFGIVLDKYPESSQLQDASVGLASALVNQNKHERGHVIMDFISKRWPRYYISDPSFLLRHAANEEKLKRTDSARDLYWLFVNLDPKRAGNDEILLKMADDYMREGNSHAANFIYSEIEQTFPGTQSAIKARLRLAEKGIYDEPVTYAEMSKVFDKSAKPTLWQVYNELVDSSATNPDAILARLKRAMWLYWDQQYPEAMGAAAEFIDNYPENKENKEARELIWQAFRKEMDQSLDEHNYGRILLLWNGFPYVRERYGKMDAPLRYALAQGWQERGDEQKSFDLLKDFLKDPMDPNYGEAAFSQFFNNYLKNGDWGKILELGNLVKNWKMRPELQNQLDYGMALSAQNLNLGAPALTRWRALAGRNDIPLYQRAYATYFLAKDAENNRDIRNAYERNRKVIEMFTQLADERSDKADPDRIKEATASLMDICEVGNRVPEALQWVERYSAYVPQDSPEYPGLRFREARLYRKLGDNARAQALLEGIVSNFPDSPFAQAASGELRTFDVSRDLSRYMPGTPPQNTVAGTGTTSGNWSSSGPTQAGGGNSGS